MHGRISEAVINAPACIRKHTERRIYAGKYPAGISVYPSTEKMDRYIKCFERKKEREREREIFNKNLNMYQIYNIKLRLKVKFLSNACDDN